MTASCARLQSACRRLMRARQAIDLCQDCGPNSDLWWPRTEKVRLAVELALQDVQRVLNEPKPKARKKARA